MKNYLMLVSACVCLAACATGSNSNSTAADETPAFQKSIAYIPSALGPHSWKITTDSAQAQQYFDQGLQLRYAYGVDDAALHAICDSLVKEVKSNLPDYVELVCTKWI